MPTAVASVERAEKSDRTFGCANKATRLDTLSGPTHVRRSFNPWPGYGSNRGELAGPNVRAGPAGGGVEERLGRGDATTGHG